MNKVKFIVVVAAVFLFCKNTHAQKNVSPATITELEDVEMIMFDRITHGDAAYCKTYLSEDFFAINADGATATKEQVCGDTTRGKFMSQFSYKYLDKQIRVYDNVAITNGRVQGFMKDALLVEFLYTAIFVKQNGKWIYTSWQGTISKDSPKPPPIPRQ